MASRVLDGAAAVGSATAEIRKLSDLLEVSQTLSSTLNLKSALTRVVELLKERHGLLNTSVVLLDPDTAQLAIEVAAGLSWQATGRVRYRVGEGITGRVVETGKPDAFYSRLTELAASGEEDEVRRRHAEYFLALAESVEPRLRAEELAHELRMPHRGL